MMRATYRSGRITETDHSAKEAMNTQHLAGEFLAEKHRRLRGELSAAQDSVMGLRVALMVSLISFLGFGVWVVGWVLP